MGRAWWPAPCGQSGLADGYGVTVGKPVDEHDVSRATTAVAAVADGTAASQYCVTPLVTSIAYQAVLLPLEAPAENTEYESEVDPPVRL